MSKEQTILQAIKKGPMRTSELECMGVSRATIMRLANKGIIERISRGLYGIPAGDYDENQQLIEVCKQAPKGVICLLTALQYYGITTELPHQIWLAIEGKSRAPAISYPPIKISRFTGASYLEGVKDVSTPNGSFRIYTPAKTVADCFKYRNKIGKDVAIKALKDCRERRLSSIDELMYYAKICKVHNIIRPYMEAITNG